MLEGRVSPAIGLNRKSIMSPLSKVLSASKNPNGVWVWPSPWQQGKQENIMSPLSKVLSASKSGSEEDGPYRKVWSTCKYPNGLKECSPQWGSLDLQGRQQRLGIGRKLCKVLSQVSTSVLKGSQKEAVWCALAASWNAILILSKWITHPKGHFCS